MNYLKTIKLLPYKWELIVLLWLAFFINQADRQIFNVVLLLLRQMFAFVIGASAPFILGKIKPVLGLAWGLSALSVVYIFSALCLFIAVKFFYKNDIIK